MKKLFTTLAVILFSVTSLLADETSVSIEGPNKVEKNSEVEITINVKHSGNNFIHHTNWVYLKVNGKEVKRWEYSMTNQPEEENFKLKYSLNVDKETHIEVKGNCNMHGSNGAETMTIEIK